MPAMTMTFPAGNSRPHLAMFHKGDTVAITVAIHVANRGEVIQIVDFRMNH
jgi:Cu/Ag efflux protein CusF